MTTSVAEGAAQEVLNELREQTKWLRFLGMRALGPILEGALRNDRERLAYELSDGRSSDQIGPLVGVSGRSIRNWWQRWETAGIAVAQSGGRVVRLASLTQLGIPVPTLTSDGLKAATGDNGHTAFARPDSADA